MTLIVDSFSSHGQDLLFKINSTELGWFSLVHGGLYTINIDYLDRTNKYVVL